jgi:16S rRNA (cytosine967-C5)-methyltransferase
VTRTAGVDVTARELALRVVRDVFPQPQSRAVERGAQASFDYHARRGDLNERDRAFAAELAYGAIKLRRALDWYLDPFLRPQQLPAVIREILRLAVYELIYTRADEHATVFEFVNLAKRCAHRGLANLVNAVLRNFLRNRPEPPRRESFENDDDYLATCHSLPTWLVRQWHEIFPDRLESICEAVNHPPVPAIVVNAIKAAPQQVAERIGAAGLQTHPSAIVPEVLLMRRGTPLHGDGTWWPQSESSAMPVDVMGPQPGEAILDVCSGRGNKALQIGARLAGEGSLFCIERDARKVATLEHRMDEAGIAAAIVTGDATAANILPRDRGFDRALLDAPCSGIGVVGRHPETRWKKLGSDGERLALTQRALLDATAKHVYPGGALVYAVCSTDPRETTEVIDGFLARQNFERGLIPAAYESLLTDQGDVLVPPGLDGRDGFYIARIERRA